MKTLTIDPSIQDPINIDLPPTVDPDMMMDKINGWPDSVLLIEVEDGKYAAVNFTTSGGDPMTMGGLAMFSDQEEASVFMQAPTLGIRGKTVQKSLEEAREITISKKPILAAMCLMIGAKIAEIQYV